MATDTKTHPKHPLSADDAITPPYLTETTSSSQVNTLIIMMVISMVIILAVLFGIIA